MPEKPLSQGKICFLPDISSGIQESISRGHRVPPIVPTGGFMPRWISTCADHDLNLSFVYLLLDRQANCYRIRWPRVYLWRIFYVCTCPPDQCKYVWSTQFLSFSPCLPSLPFFILPEVRGGFLGSDSPVTSLLPPVLQEVCSVVSGGRVTSLLMSHRFGSQ